MFNISKDTLSNAVPHFRDAIVALFFATVTLGLADHLITGPHVHTIATGVVMYLATAGLTLIEERGTHTLSDLPTSSR